MIRAADMGEQGIGGDVAWDGSTKERVAKLLEASESGRTAEALEIVAGGVHVDAALNGSMTPLAAAAWHGRVETVRALIEAGADLEAKGGSGAPALIFALRSPSMKARDSALVLVEAGADPDATCSHDDFPLRLAVNGGAGEVVRALLAAGADPMRLDCDGLTALGSASRGVEGAGECVRALGRGAVLADPRSARICMEMSLQRGKEDLLRALLECGLDPNIDPAAVAQGAISPLERAVRRGSAGCAQMLLDHGARPLEPGKRVSALSRMAFKEGRPAIAALIEARALAMREERTLSKAVKSAKGGRRTPKVGGAL